MAIGNMVKYTDAPWASGWKSAVDGWSRDRSPWPASSMPTPPQMIATPLYKPFNKAPNGQSVHDAQGSILLADAKTAGTAGYPYLAALLAQDVPVLSWPAGSRPVGAFDTQKMDLQDLVANGWDPNRDTFRTNNQSHLINPGKVGEGRWHHSDIKNVSYYYNYKLFQFMVTNGSLKN